ncbi:hypothetical protein [Herbaspirillum sp. ST 5-3]|uniref:hypothetical protein n=1 Tax=Oxalobacteraceae TaxID=75682 RepID=UPI0010A47A38|nr:hypothetical protein [Herbaspirillum sp. ST 5-3]
MQTFSGYIRAFLSLAVLAGLAACGGGHSTVELGGKVTGLTRDGLALANGNSTITIPANATSYKFPDEIDNFADYNVTILSQPVGITCNLVNAKGSATGIPITWVNVSCSQNTYTLGGTITGLTAGPLVLVNGSDTVSISANSTSYVFPTAVAQGAVYGVAVLTQPPGLTCSVTNGTAVMGSGNVTNVQVNCQ